MIVKRLIKNLESQVEMHEVLLETLNQELELPASCSLLELEEIQSARTTTVKRIGELESSRIALISAVETDPSKEGNITLSDIIKSCDIDQKSKLIDLKKQLNQVISQIRVTSRKNAEKATARIACFREVHNSIHKSFHRHPVYSVNGTMNEVGGSCLIKRSV